MVRVAEVSIIKEGVATAGLAKAEVVQALITKAEEVKVGSATGKEVMDLLKVVMAGSVEEEVAMVGQEVCSERERAGMVMDTEAKEVTVMALQAREVVMVHQREEEACSEEVEASAEVEVVRSKREQENIAIVTEVAKVMLILTDHQRRRAASVDGATLPMFKYQFQIHGPLQLYHRNKETPMSRIKQHNKWMKCKSTLISPL